jgi:hypothetical protein
MVTSAAFMGGGGTQTAAMGANRISFNIYISKI